MNSDNKLWQKAIGLAYLTIIYNILEGLFAIYFGWKNESLALFGFGIDSFIESLSASGILFMIYRIRKNENKMLRYESIALKITAISFWILSIGLLVEIIEKIINKENPITTIPAIIITLLSILIMLFIYIAKIKIGNQLNSQPIISDARCSLVCIYLSIIVLISSLLYHFLHVPYIDSIGAAGVAYFSFKEGKEAFHKAKYKKECCNDCC